jgi:hypothetical protein
MGPGLWRASMSAVDQDIESILVNYNK